LYVDGKVLIDSASSDITTTSAETCASSHAVHAAVHPTVNPACCISDPIALDEGKHMITVDFIASNPGHEYLTRGIDSKHQIILGSEMSVIYTSDGKTMSVYLNGQLHCSFTDKTATRIFRDSLFVGSDPWYPGFKGSMRNLCLHDCPLSVDQAQRLAAHDASPNPLIRVRFHLSLPDSSL